MGGAEDRRELARVYYSYAADNRGYLGAKADVLERCADLLESGRCAWSPDDDGIYGTSCGHFHEFIFGATGDNGFRFCPYCGGAIVESRRP